MNPKKLLNGQDIIIDIAESSCLVTMCMMLSPSPVDSQPLDAASRISQVFTQQGSSMN
jgi:hypothetical protein